VGTAGTDSGSCRETDLVLREANLCIPLSQFYLAMEFGIFFCISLNGNAIKIISIGL
jgi:hypothetical protein